MQSVPTFSDILYTAGQLTDCAACLPPLSARAPRVRRTADGGLPLALRRQVRASLQAAHDVLTDALARYTANAPHPEQGLMNEAARLCTLLSAHASPRRLPVTDPATVPPETAAAQLLSLSDKLKQQAADCPTLVDWSHPDVLVGSLRSDEQYRINTQKNFYYAPIRVVMPESLPVQYVALCRSAVSDEPGVRCFGEVKSIRTIRRKRIPVPTKADNGNDLYYIFPVRAWTSLPTPIAIREEGVYAPRFTNLFLLTHSHATYELFDIPSEAAYRLHAALSGLAEDDPAETPLTPVRITDRLSLSLTDGRFILSDTRSTALVVLPLSEFRTHPGRILRTLLAAGGLQ